MIRVIFVTKMKLYYFYPAWKKVAECVYNTSDYPRPSMFRNDYLLNPECQENDGDDNTGACFERFATKGLFST